MMRNRLLRVGIGAHLRRQESLCTPLRASMNVWPSVHPMRSSLIRFMTPALLNASNVYKPDKRCFSMQSFQELGLHEKLQQALTDIQIAKPTVIQMKSIQAILAGKDILCTAQTGTGKTLAYLLPVIEQFQRFESGQSEEARKKMLLSRPQAIVLLPSRELALQVSDVAKHLAHFAKFSSCVITSGERKSIQQRNTAKRLDLVIGTPGRLAKCIKNGEIFVSRVRTVVIDEADTLLDAKMGFRKELDEVLGPIQASAMKRKQSLQMILVAATIKPPLDQVLKRKFGELRLVSDEQIHQTPATIQEQFIRVNPETKQSALREALYLRQTKNYKTIIFCRNSASCRSTDHMLREHGFHSLCLHGDMPRPLRHTSVQRFLTDDHVNILVCTDLAARGLHFDHVHHVIMFDFPNSAVDYVHRAGRTGRAGEKGFVTSLVTKYDLPLARSLEDSKRHKNPIKELRLSPSSATDVNVIPVDKPAGVTRDETDGSQARQLSRNKAKHALKKAAGYGTKKLQKHKLRTLRR